MYGITQVVFVWYTFYAGKSVQIDPEPVGQAYS